MPEQEGARGGLFNIFAELGVDISRLREGLDKALRETESTAGRIEHSFSSGFRRGVRQSGEALDDLGARVGRFAAIVRNPFTIGATAGVAFLEVLRRGVVQSLEFERAFERANLALFRTGENIERLKTLIRELDGELGSGQELAQGFSVAVTELSGVSGQLAVELTKIGAKFAILTDTTPARSVQFLTDVIEAYGKQAGDAADISGKLLEIMRRGSGTFDEIEGLMRNLGPLASELGFGFDDVATAIRVMGDAGVPARRSLLALNGLFPALIANAESFREVGINIRQVIRDSGLIGLISAIRDFTGGDEERLRTLGVTGRTLGPVLKLLQADINDVQRAFNEIRASGSELLDELFGNRVQRASEQTRLLRNEWNLFLTELGATVSPPFVDILRTATQLLREIRQLNRDVQREIDEFPDRIGKPPDVGPTGRQLRGLTFGTGVGALLGLTPPGLAIGGPLVTGGIGAVVGTGVATSFGVADAIEQRKKAIAELTESTLKAAEAEVTRRREILATRAQELAQFPLHAQTTTEILARAIATSRLRSAEEQLVEAESRLVQIRRELLEQEQRRQDFEHRRRINEDILRFRQREQAVEGGPDPTGIRAPTRTLTRERIPVTPEEIRRFALSEAEFAREVLQVAKAFELQARQAEVNRQALLGRLGILTAERDVARLIEQERAAFEARAVQGTDAFQRERREMIEQTLNAELDGIERVSQANIEALNAQIRNTERAVTRLRELQEFKEAPDQQLRDFTERRFQVLLAQLAQARAAGNEEQVKQITALLGPIAQTKAVLDEQSNSFLRTRQQIIELETQLINLSAQRGQLESEAERQRVQAFLNARKARIDTRRQEIQEQVLEGQEAARREDELFQTFRRLGLIRLDDELRRNADIITDSRRSYSERMALATGFYERLKVLADEFFQAEVAIGRRNINEELARFRDIAQDESRRLEERIRAVQQSFDLERRIAEERFEFRKSLLQSSLRDEIQFWASVARAAERGSQVQIEAMRRVANLVRQQLNEARTLLGQSLDQYAERFRKLGIDAEFVAVRESSLERFLARQQERDQDVIARWRAGQSVNLQRLQEALGRQTFSEQFNLFGGLSSVIFRALQPLQQAFQDAFMLDPDRLNSELGDVILRYRGAFDTLRSMAADAAEAMQESLSKAIPPPTFPSQVAIPGVPGTKLGEQIPAYERGTTYVPRTGLAVIHRGEAVIPAQHNPFKNVGSVRLDQPTPVTLGGLEALDRVAKAGQRPRMDDYWRRMEMQEAIKTFETPASTVVNQLRQSGAIDQTRFGQAIELMGEWVDRMVPEELKKQLFTGNFKRSPRDIGIDDIGNAMPAIFPMFNAAVSLLREELDKTPAGNIEKTFYELLLGAMWPSATFGAGLAAGLPLLRRASELARQPGVSRFGLIGSFGEAVLPGSGVVRPFYSQLERAIDQKLPQIGTAEQVLAIAKQNSRAEELAWTGLESHVAERLARGEKRFHKDEIIAYLQEHRVPLEERIFGHGRRNINYRETLKRRLEGIQGAYEEQYSHVHAQLTDSMMRDGIPAEYRALRHEDAATQLLDNMMSGNPHLRFESRRHVRQLFSHLDEQQFDDTVQELRRLSRLDRRASYQYSRYLEEHGLHHPSYFTHEAGGRSFGLEPMEGRELVLKIPSRELEGVSYRQHQHMGGEENVLVWARFNTRIDKDGKRTLFIEELQSDWHQKGQSLGYLTRDQFKHSLTEFPEGYSISQVGAAEWTLSRPDGRRVTFDADSPEQARRLALHMLDEWKLTGELVPDAPFKKTWHELALKRILRYAAEHDFDYIAWTTAEQQKLRWHRDDAKFFEMLYDTKIPSFMRSQARKYGDDLRIIQARNVPEEPTQFGFQPGVALTPAWKDALLKQGLPIFSLAGLSFFTGEEDQQDFSGFGPVMLGAVPFMRWSATSRRNLAPLIGRLGSRSPFFSALEQTIEQKMQSRGTADQILSIARGAGVRREELIYSGLEEYLADRARSGPIPKEEVLEFLRHQRPPLKETLLGSRPGKTGEVKNWREEARRLEQEYFEVLDIFDGYVMTGLTNNPTMRREITRRYGEDDIEFMASALRMALLDRHHRHTIRNDLLSVMQSANVPQEEATQLIDKLLRLRRQYRIAYNRAERQRDDAVGKPQYQQYQLKGDKEEYRELVLQWAPPKGTTRRNQLFSTAHFQGVANPFVWGRFNTRLDNKGRKILFIEEIQSDWHSRGYHEGYRPRTPLTQLPDDVRLINEAELSDKDYLLDKVVRQFIPRHADDKHHLFDVNRIREMFDSSGDLHRLYSNQYHDFYLEDLQDLVQAISARGDDPTFTHPVLDRLRAIDPYFGMRDSNRSPMVQLVRKDGTVLATDNLTHYESPDDTIARLTRNALDQLNTSGVLDVPFKKTYHELMLKRLLHFAAEQNYDAVAWTRPDQQWKRWSLGSYIDELRYEQDSPATVALTGMKNRHEVFRQEIDLKELDRYVDQHTATRIIEDLKQQRLLRRERSKMIPEDFDVYPDSWSEQWIYKYSAEGGSDIAHPVVGYTLLSVQTASREEALQAAIEKYRRNILSTPLSGKIDNFDASIGDPFHKMFYEQWIGGFMQRFARKHGGDLTDFVPPGKFNHEDLERFSKQPGILLTPDVKRKILEEGLPLYSIGTGLLGAGMTAELYRRMWEAGEIPAYQQGTPWVPRTGLAVLHQGEAVIPADENTRRFGMSANLGQNAIVEAINHLGTRIERVFKALVADLRGHRKDAELEARTPEQTKEDEDRLKNPLKYLTQGQVLEQIDRRHIIPLGASDDKQKHIMASRQADIEAYNAKIAAGDFTPLRDYRAEFDRETPRRILRLGADDKEHERQRELFGLDVEIFDMKLLAERFRTGAAPGGPRGPEAEFSLPALREFRGARHFGPPLPSEAHYSPRLTPEEGLHEIPSEELRLEFERRARELQGRHPLDTRRSTMLGFEKKVRYFDDLNITPQTSEAEIHRLMRERLELIPEEGQRLERIPAPERIFGSLAQGASEMSGMHELFEPHDMLASLDGIESAYETTFDRVIGLVRGKMSELRDVIQDGNTEIAEAIVDQVEATLAQRLEDDVRRGFVR